MAAGLPARIARSLLHDLLIPWIISVGCIAFFLALVMTFSLLAWPVCFLIFIAICKIREADRKANEATARERGSQASGTSDASGP